MTTPRPDAGPTPQLTVGLLAGLALTLPFHAVLGTRSDGALYGWMLGGVALAVALGVVARLAGVRRGAAVVCAAAGAFLLLALIGVRICAATSSPPGDTATTVIVGIPAAVLGALTAVAVLRRTPDPAALPLAGGILTLCFLLAAGLAIPVGKQLQQARMHARWADVLERSSLSPYRPDIAGMDLQFGGITTRGGEPIGYSLFAHPHGVEYGPFISIEPAQETDYCALYPPCEKDDGYLVARHDGEVQAIETPALDAVFISGQPGVDGMPDAATIGRALREARQVSWHSLTSTGN
ncbi:MAG TPA: hypothetical protein VN088_06305 [Nocardioides sp.]|nr:hypothetical protein [Nocardioides sp.]